VKIHMSDMEDVEIIVTIHNSVIFEFAKSKLYDMGYPFDTVDKLTNRKLEL
jgi:hypothetical protein